MLLKPSPLDLNLFSIFDFWLVSQDRSLKDFPQIF